VICSVYNTKKLFELGRFENNGGGAATAVANGGDAVTAVSLTQRGKQRDEDACTAAADWVA